MTTPKFLGAAFNTKLLTAGWSPNVDRFYPIDAFHRVMDQFRPNVGDFLLAGEERALRPKMENISHRTNSLFLANDNTELWAEVQLLDTPNGNILYMLNRRSIAKFDAMVLGKVNYCNEVQVETIQFVRVIAYGTQSKRGN